MGLPCRVYRSDAGVGMSPCGVLTTPARAAPEVALMLKELEPTGAGGPLLASAGRHMVAAEVPETLGRLSRRSPVAVAGVPVLANGEGPALRGLLGSSDALHALSSVLQDSCRRELCAPGAGRMKRDGVCQHWV